MNFSPRFSETRLEKAHNRLRLVGKDGELLLELKGQEIADAERAGFIDLDNCHFSLFEYARMRITLPQQAPVTAGSAPANFDRSFLSDLKISWD